MSQSIEKLIQLSQRLQLPVVVHDSRTGASAVLMGVEEYERMAYCSAEMEDEWGFGEEEEGDDWDGGISFTDKGKNLDWGNSKSTPTWYISQNQEENWAERDLYPAFSPDEEDDSGEEPIFFEEPV